MAVFNQSANNMQAVIETLIRVALPVLQVQTVLQDVGFQCWVQFGHVHRLDSFIKRGEDFQVGAVASGCLCLYPHYHRGRMTSKWQQGTAIMEVDLNSRFVKIENLLFERDHNQVWVRFERKLFRSANPQ